MELFKILGTIAINNSDAINKMKGSTEEASKVSDAFEKIGASALKIGKVMAVAMGAGATALATLTKASLDAYANYEQLVGGVETIFGAGGKSLKEYADSVGMTVEEVEAEYNNLMMAQETVMAHAREAYNTAGLSANQYMETVTSFSASLIQSLEGDTVASANLANQAIVDMSDNANKMGTSMEMIQNAYNGFAKQNYMMLDNLKLGYGGTKAEMERLLEDAEAIQAKQGNMVDYSIESYADVINAIHDVQTEMGITGTTAMEAEKTISGSCSAMKASWKNLVTGLGDENANLEQLINQFVNKASIAFGNILPRIEQILKGIATLIKQIVPQITEMLPGLIEEVLPPLLEATAELIQGLADAIPELLNILLEVLPEFVNLGVEIIGSILEGILDNIGSIGESATEIVVQLATGIIQLLPTFLEVGIKLIVSIIQGISQSLPQIIDTIVDVVLQLVEVWFENLPLIYEAGLELIVKLVEGILEALPDLLEKMPEIIQKMVEALLSVIDLIIDAGVQLLTALIDNLPLIIDTIVKVLPQIIDSIIATLTSDHGLTKIIDAGVTLLVALVENIDEIISIIIKAVPKIVDGISNAFEKNSEELKDAGVDIAYKLLEGLQKGWKTVEKWAWGSAGTLGHIFSGGSSFDNVLSIIPQTGNSRGGKIGGFAEGGVVEKGHIAFLEGYGTEAVVPLEKNKQWIGKVADDMDSALGGNGTAEKLDRLIALQESMLDIMPALANVSIKLNNRELGRAVRQVNV